MYHSMKKESGSKKTPKPVVKGDKPISQISKMVSNIVIQAKKVDKLNHASHSLNGKRINALVDNIRRVDNLLYTYVPKKSAESLKKIREAWDKKHSS